MAKLQVFDSFDELCGEGDELDQPAIADGLGRTPRMIAQANDGYVTDALSNEIIFDSNTEE